MAERCSCGMPLNEETRCQCQPNNCIHCCTCAPDCQCGCKAKAQSEEK